MNKAAMPKAGDWEHYWGMDQTEKFTKISWSKKRLMSLLESYTKTGNSALDAGCGSGFFSKFFCEHGMQVTSLDYSNEALKITEQLSGGRSTLIQMDLLKERLEEKTDNRFHLIFTDGLFEHFSSEEQNAIFSNLKSVLNDDGVIVTVVPNRYSPWELIRPFYMPGIKEDPFVLSELIALNENNGMKIMEKGGLNTFPFAFSPDRLIGSAFGMLLYTVSKK